MKIARMDVYPIVIPYRHVEESAIISRSGVSDVVVRLETDEGVVGWGEACMNCDTATTVASVEAARPIVMGRDPWETEAIARDVFVHGGWQWQPMTGAFAFAGIDMALWDICGKIAGQPLYRLFGGALNEEIDYFYYLAWADEAGLRAQCADALARGYGTFYFKAGVDFERELAMLEIVRDAIGPAARLRVDPNQAWPFADALRHVARMHERCRLDFVEAPVSTARIENLLELARRTGVPVCANEGLWTEADASRIIQARAVDHLGFSPYFVGSLRRWQTLCRMAALNDIQVHKHTHGEFGIAAAACQHVLLTLPNVAPGSQQTASILADDILAEPVPIATGPRWGRIEGPGLGVRIDEDKLAFYHRRWREDGDFKPYGNRFPRA
jgi:L-alanine-DL-glutamate epimerase-like enolase superfamily enzyme